MKVKKLIAKNQNEGWFERITEECKREYPIYLMGELGEDELVIDCGCNVGGFAEAYNSRFKNFLAIDASSYNVEEYKKHHKHKVIHTALSAKDGEVVELRKYMGNGDDDTNSGNFGITGFVSAGNNHGYRSEDYEEVTTTSLETILKGIDEVGLLKVDIEGAEYDFLLNKDLSKIKWITGEFHNFLGDEKQIELFNWIGKTHEEVYSEGTGIDSHFQKAWRRI